MRWWTVSSRGFRTRPTGNVDSDYNSNDDDDDHNDDDYDNDEDADYDADYDDDNDNDDDDIYIMMKCVSVCVSRKIITSHFRAERRRREVSSPLGRRPALA